MNPSSPLETVFKFGREIVGGPIVTQSNIQTGLNFPRPVDLAFTHLTEDLFDDATQMWHTGLLFTRP